MKKIATLALMLFAATPAYAQTAKAPLILWNDVFATVVYSLIGVALAVVAYKIVDLVIPGDLGHELVEEHNTSIAVVIGAMILGVCIIIASVMVN